MPKRQPERPKEGMWEILARNYVEKYKPTRNPQEFHISIGASSTTPGVLDHEMRMVKAAALYADHITLYSLDAYLSLLIREIETLDIEDQFRAFEANSKDGDVSEEVLKGARLGIAHYRELAKLPNPTSEQLAYLAGMRNAVVRANARFLQSETAQTEKRIAADLIRAVDAGIVDAHAFGGKITSEEVVTEFMGCSSQKGHLPAGVIHF